MIVTAHVRPFIARTTTLAALCGVMSCARPEPPSPATTPPPAATAPPPAALPQPVRTPPTSAADIPLEQREQPVYDGPFDAANRLVITTTYTNHRGSCCSTVLHVSMIDRADATRRWEIDSISEQYEYDYEVTRIDPPAVVLCRTESYGMEAGCFKVFMDPARRLVTRAGFDLAQDVAFASDSEARRLLGVSAQDLSLLKQRMVFRATAAGAEPPAAFAAHPLPQSTYQDFARARPARVENGYREGHTKIEEKIGAWQADAGGFWFTKTFYDGEGTTGVGAVGFLNPNGRYTLLTIPALVDWSADAILVEPDAVWAGLVIHPEGGDTSGGLLRYDRQTHSSDVHKIPGVILRIVHLGDAVFLGTTHGLYVLRNDTITWHHMEPDVTGRPVVITETLSK